MRPTRRALPSREAARSEGGGLIEILDVCRLRAHSIDGNMIRLRNCPFDALVDEHRPLVCGTNLALAQGIVDGHVRRGRHRLPASTRPPAGLLLRGLRGDSILRFGSNSLT